MVFNPFHPIDLAQKYLKIKRYQPYLNHFHSYAGHLIVCFRSRLRMVVFRCAVRPMITSLALGEESALISFDLMQASSCAWKSDY